ncbi:aminoacyl-histidine dipeptidase [Porphyromonas crevioricanis]|uniref:Cytosol non-specific dipeptidase n=2 Tax=Porphyromonas crevioricanis TaxID=393921 RepID=A0A0A2FSJ6_9PORP|nr:aminoacyl-histidine dipeptidase [Porphyromonas crevioricanis]KGN89921.1 aminoacyl-histidine dipeptidase [Porphyromonas crevioricanis]KGN94106.1 aminoacyl-histidine dipeptidase [Porphyromonas crevioricanis]SJZ65769.1 dipeptidase D [Porphyromonas crevioricanis]SQH73913.1 Cytosol non-specific dipeptidase [Porphyromonas crevioricanis]GAD04753.1 aminoacyl-histidine dipeptidase [Porphyromonas crevioricanis JCM 15906]
MKMTDLKPTILWQCFDEITKVPRPSKKEEKIIAYLEEFARKHNIDYSKDQIGNIVMRKPATKGYEHLETVILQSHMDMVCEKNSDVVHDFEKDPIRTVVDGDWLRAEGTTLGADNGIGCAAQMAVLISNDIEHGPLECLFTVDEETGLTGAQNIQPGFLSGKILLNLDSEDEGEMFIGCAGGKDTQGLFTYKKEELPQGYIFLKVSVSGLRGGHSGGDIHLGLGNANKLLARFLMEVDKEMSWVLSEIKGGNLRNAIAREAYAIIGIEAAKKETVRVLLNEFSAAVENELSAVEPSVKFSLETAETPDFKIDCTTKHNLLLALIVCPHGVLGMSHEIEGLVETSTNLASVKMIEDNGILIGTSQRSSTESLKIAACDQVASTFRLAGAEVRHSDGYPGWKPNPNSKILQAASDTYEEIFGKKPAIKAIHAGLECGLFLDKYPYLDMVSFGPTLRDVHSPAERIEIKTVQMWWDHLLLLLKRIPSAKA